MRFTKLLPACLIVCALVGGSALAQEGFPLKGSWIGDWSPNQTTRNQVFIVMDWDGKSITGMINPGTDNIPLKNATLSADWLVHFEADARDRSGAAVHYVIDGKIENVGLANRAIAGTWTVGTMKNDFRLVRQ
jgi:hypothetical protein